MIVIYIYLEEPATMSAADAMCQLMLCPSMYAWSWTEVLVLVSDDDCLVACVLWGVGGWGWGWIQDITAMIIALVLFSF